MAEKDGAHCTQPWELLISCLRRKGAEVSPMCYHLQGQTAMQPDYIHELNPRPYLMLHGKKATKPWACHKDTGKTNQAPAE